jgi:DNA-binding transcriptional LysR family regulator
MLDVHLEKLRFFYLAAKEKSFLKAAGVLRVTQPAVTKSVRRLEELLGTQLFVRRSRGVELTESGRILEEFCDCLFLKVRDLEQRLRSQQELSGVVRIGTYETLGELFWPKVLRKLSALYPALVVELQTDSTKNMWEALAVGRVDLVLDAEPMIGEHLFSKVLYIDRFGIFCRKGSAFIEQKQTFPVPISYVRKAVDRNGMTIEYHIRKTGLPTTLRYDVESFTMVRSFVLEDICIGVLPLQMAAGYLKRGTIIPFGVEKSPKPFGEHRICITCLDSSKHDQKIRLLMTLLQREV